MAKVNKDSATAGAVPFDSEPTTLSAIQARLEALAAAMLAKGVVNPSADFTMKSNTGSHVWLDWGRPGESNAYKMFPGAPEKAFAAAHAYVAALPTAEETRMAAFLAHLDETIQLGKKADVEVEAINPLLEIFKRISKSAITHQAQA